MSQLVHSFHKRLSLVRGRLKRRFPRGSLPFRVLRPFSQLVERAFPLYRRLSGDGVFYRESELSMNSLSCPQIVDTTVDLFEPGSVLDLGCGTGVSLDRFKSLGIDVVGVEASELAIAKARHPRSIVKHNLNRELDLGRKFDLVWSFEVVEHLRAKYVENLVSTFSNHGDLVVMSAAPPGQGGEGHFNEQPPSYWIEKFFARGYRLEKESTERLRSTGDPFCENMLVFIR